MHIKSILVATDLSVREDAAFQRAQHLATIHRATLQLMYVPPVRQLAAPDAAARLAAAARRLEDGLGRPVKKVPVKAHMLKDLQVEARSADLLVLPHRQERSTAAFFRGRPVMQIVRECRRPVLVVRSHRRSKWERVLVAIDFAHTSRALAVFAARLDPQAQLQLFHVIDRRDEATLRSAGPSAPAGSSFRAQCLTYAHARMHELAGILGTGRLPLVTVMGYGDPGHEAVLHQAHTAADCVVVGKRETSRWSDFFRGSVAHRVLSWASSDVLVVPDGWPQLARRHSRSGGGGARLHVWPQAVTPLERSAA